MALLITWMTYRVPRRGSFSFPFIPADCSKPNPSLLCPSNLANPTGDLQISQGKALLGTKGLAQKPQRPWDELPDLHLLQPRCLEAPWLSKCSGNPDNSRSNSIHPTVLSFAFPPGIHGTAFAGRTYKCCPKNGELEEEKTTQQPRKQPLASSTPSSFPIRSFLSFFTATRLSLPFFSFCLSPASESEGKLGLRQREQ